MQLQKQNINNNERGLSIVYSDFFKLDPNKLLKEIKDEENKVKYLKGKYESKLNEKEKYELHLEKIKMLDYLKNYKIDGILFSSEIETDNVVPFNYLFYRGNINLMLEKNIAIIGSRKTTEYIEKLTKKIVTAYIKDNYNVISGLANGTDTVALTECVNHHYKSIAVLPTPFSKISPVKNKGLLEKIVSNGGLVLTEYYDIIRINKGNFLKRNKVINFCSISTLATEFGVKSGTNNQIKNALNSDKIIATFEPKYLHTYNDYVEAYEKLLSEKSIHILKDRQSINKYLENLKRVS